MVVKELFEQANKNDYTDLQALIMFLVFEKKALKMEDDTREIDLYFLEKHSDRMNRELMSYKKKMSIKAKPVVYEIEVEQKDLNLIFVLAENYDQAISFTRSLFYKPVKTSICNKERLMSIWDKKGKEHVVSMKSIIDQEKKVPAFLGGYDV